VMRTSSATLGKLLLLTLFCAGVWTACRDFASPAEELNADGMSKPTSGGGAQTAGALNETVSNGGASGRESTVQATGGAGADSKGGAGADSKGGAGADSKGGAAGNHSTVQPNGGANDGGEGGNEEVIRPSCVSDSTNPGVVSFETPGALAASIIPNGEPYVLYATEPSVSSVAIRWRQAPDDTAGWEPWLCFDLVPHADRIAATNLTNSTPEVYATSSNGTLYVRRFTLDRWDAWGTVGLPSMTSRITDVAAVADAALRGFVYVIDSSRLFVRHHLSADAFSDYTPWSNLPTPLGAPKRLCAGRLPDNRQQLFVAAEDGSITTSIEQEVDGAFEPFQSFGNSSVSGASDIDCGYLADGSLAVFALVAGNVWSRPASGASTWMAEQAGPTLATLAVGSAAAQTPTVFGTDLSNATWWHRAGSADWATVD
jgi:hypothetical protein